MGPTLQWTGDNFAEVEEFTASEDGEIRAHLDEDGNLILDDKPDPSDTNYRQLPVLLGQFITKRSETAFLILNAE